MISLAFNFVSQIIKNFSRIKMFVPFMLVHYFIWLSVRVEFKFEFEFK